MCSRRRLDPRPDEPCTLVAEFSEEPESEIKARRKDRAFDYNYTAAADLLVDMKERRESDRSRSQLEIDWMLHDECLMQFLEGYPLPPRCMFECRINGDNPNLFRAKVYPHLMPDSLANTKNPYLLSDDMWVLRFNAEDIPYHNPIIGPLPDQLVPGLVRFLESRERLVVRGDPGTLWLNRDGGSLNATTFCKLVRNICESYLKHRIPPSAFQDIAAYRLLADNPEDYSTLASLRCRSEHSVKMRFDRKYRNAHRRKPY